MLCSCSTVKQNGPAAENTVDAPDTGQLAPKPGVACKLPPGQEEEAELASLPESEQTIEEELAGLKKLQNWEESRTSRLADIDPKRYDFPVVVNQQVEYYLDYFTTEKRAVFGRWLTRSGRYLPMIKAQLKEAGLPLDLAYLAMIESGFVLHAHSRASAVGPWQFIEDTGRRFGLTVNDYLDERRDPEKATRAAVVYLGKLYREFQSWHLAVAAYNAGEGKIRRGLEQFGSNNFWHLAQQEYLALETKRYVPMLIAAIILANDPAKYGFTDICFENPLAYDTISVPRWASLKAVANATDISLEELRKLNIELRRETPPPNCGSYELKIPVGTRAQVAENLHRVKPVVQLAFKDHVIQKGETVASICSKYNITKTALLKANNLRSSTIVAGRHLRIPQQTTSYERTAGKTRDPGTVTPEKQEKTAFHKVKKGETLSGIAKRYGVSSQQIAKWNSLSGRHTLAVGQKLAVSLPAASKTAGTAASPARKSKEEAKNAAVASAKGKGASNNKIAENSPTYYNVKGGDTLWTIAQKYNLTPQKIKQWNNLSNDNIQPGLRLMLMVSADLD